MEDLFDQLINAVGEHLSGITDSGALDNLMEQSSDLINESIANLGDNISNLDESSFNEILNHVIDSLGIDAASAAENISVAAGIDSTSFMGNAGEEAFSKIDLGITENLDGSEPFANESKSGGWQGQFTGNCWDECQASVQDPGKRLTCGYHA